MIRGGRLDPHESGGDVGKRLLLYLPATCSREPPPFYAHRGPDLAWLMDARFREHDNLHMRIAADFENVLASKAFLKPADPSHRKQCTILSTSGVVP